jgi:adenylate cyclase class 1
MAEKDAPQAPRRSGSGSEHPSAELAWGINRARLERTLSILPQRKRAVIDILNLIFHINHEHLPGYVSSATPCGIRSYSPSHHEISLAKRIWPTFDTQRRALIRMPLLGLYLMGSPGTIAFWDKSDFDIWLCHDPDLPQDSVNLLREKATLVEEWANKSGAEVHFFVVNPDSMKSGRTECLSSESSGSSQHYLLMDEFYRSHIVLSGPLPLWWVVPPDQDHRYDAYLDEQVQKGLIERGHYVDFGGIYEIPAEEFLGAAIWQLYKSIGSPYKSVMKLLLVETYVDEYPNATILCNALKKKIVEGCRDLVEIDSYLATYNKVEEYLFGLFDTPRLTLLRQSFYFKVDEHLSTPLKNSSDKTWRREYMEHLAVSWGWDLTMLTRLDHHKTWGIDVLAEDRANLFKALTRSYQHVSEFSKKHGGARISEEDLHILGRRLYAAFENKAGKVERIVRSSAANPAEKYLSLHQLRAVDKEESWSLYRGNVSPGEQGGQTPLKRGRNIADILSWCHFNRVMTTDTVVTLPTSTSKINMMEMRGLMEAFEGSFPGGALDCEPGFDELSQRPTIRAVAVFVNVGVDPMAGHGKADGSFVASSHGDCLSFGAKRDNLALTFDLVIRSSWEEVFLYHYTGPTALLDCLTEYVSWIPRKKGAAPCPIKVHCRSSTHAAAIAKRVAEALADAIHHLYETTTRNGEARAYVIQIATGYHVLQVGAEKTDTQAFPTQQKLEAYLGLPREQFCCLGIDKNALVGTVYPILYKLNRPGRAQVFFEIQKDTATLYMLDEVGCLTTNTVPFYSVDTLINPYYHFFGSIARRQLADEGESIETTQRLELVEFYRLTPPTREAPQYRLERIEPSQRVPQYHSVQAVGDLNEKSNIDFTLYCDGREFSSFNYGPRLFRAVAEYALSTGSKAYPILVTDVDLSSTLLKHQGFDKVNTAHFLKYKILVEDRLMQTFGQLANNTST